MIGKSGDKAGQAKASPAFRVSRLRALVTRVLERAEALQQGDTALSEDERVLKLIGLAVKLEAELKALKPSRMRAGEASGARRKADDEAMRQALAQRIAQLQAPASGRKPKPKRNRLAA